MHADSPAAVVRTVFEHYLYYEYDLRTGGTHRNMEAITVRDGLIRDLQVFFGGQV